MRYEVGVVKSGIIVGYINSRLRQMRVMTLEFTDGYQVWDG